MILRADISNYRLRGTEDQAKQRVLNLPTSSHPRGRSSHQWEESQKDTEIQINCKSKEKQKYSQMYELSLRRDQNR